MKKKKSFVETVEAEVFQEAGNYIKNKIRKRVLQIGEMSAAFLIGFILLLVGVAQLLAANFPLLENGYNYLLLGIVFILIGMMLR